MSLANRDKRLTLEAFDQLIIEFDQELEALGYQGRVPIRALGGYAMLVHGLRTDNPTTPDIDSSSPAMSPLEKEARNNVAKRHGLTTHWLNNDTVLPWTSEVTEDDVAVNDAIIDARYEPRDLGQPLSHVDLAVATIDTVAHAKAIAVCDIWSERGDKDLDDFLQILDHEGVDSWAAAKRRFGFLDEREFYQLHDIYAASRGMSDQWRQQNMPAMEADMAAFEIDDIQNIDSSIDSMAFDLFGTNLDPYGKDPYGNDSYNDYSPYDDLW